MNQDISFTLSLYANTKELLVNTTAIISNAKRYGIIGNNGVGKTTFLNYIRNRQHPELNKLKDIYMVNQEIASSDKTIYQTVFDSNIIISNLVNKKKDLELQLSNLDDEVEDESFNQINNDLIEVEKELFNLEYNKQESKIKKILSGLGFTNFDSIVSSYSGGWRMRIALACALYQEPSLLLLDEPTNHLDLEANIWLLEYLKSYKNTIMIISHDIEFLNELCNSIIHIEDKKLNYYNGSYNKYKKQYDKDIMEKTKNYEKIEKNIKEMKKNNKKKSEIENYLKKNPLPFIPYDKRIIIDFGYVPINETQKNLISLNDVSFSYGEKIILENISMGINFKTRIAFVGRNGSGKSTLLNLIAGKLTCDEGVIEKDDHIRIGYFNQHTFEHLPMDITPTEYLREKFTNIDENIIRGYLGKIGLEGKAHKLPISNLSGGQKVRISLVELQLIEPHIIILDEPTNHLDIQIIEALKEAINNFNGAVLITTHNIDLIEDTECQTYELDNKNCNIIQFSDYCEKILDVF